MAYDLGNLSNVTNYLSGYGSSAPTNGSMGMPSGGWDGWGSYNPSTSYNPASMSMLNASNTQVPPIHTGGGLANTLSQMQPNGGGDRKIGNVPQTPDPKAIYRNQLNSLIHPLLQARNNYAFGTNARQNYMGYLQQNVMPLQQQSQWNGVGTAPTLPNIPTYNSAQTYSWQPPSLQHMTGVMQNRSNQGG